jgi:hypothetical protein
MARFLLLRRELAGNALDAIAKLYPEKMAAIQASQAGDGKTLKNIRLMASTPEFDPVASGLQPQYSVQVVTLIISAESDYTDRSLDARYLAMIESLEDFAARADLKTHLTSAEADGIAVDWVTPDGGNESAVEGIFVTSYRIKCGVRAKVTT